MSTSEQCRKAPIFQVCTHTATDVLWYDVTESAYERFPKNQRRVVQAFAPGESVDFDAAKRLRRVLKTLGLETAVPEDDATLMGCLFSVFGIMAAKLERTREREASAVSTPAA